MAASECVRRFEDRRFIEEWQIDGENRPRSGLAFDRHPTAHRLDQAFGDCQTKTGSGRTFEIVLIHLFKFVEDTRQRACRNANARILDAQRQITPEPPGADHDAAPVGKLDRVRHEIHQDLPDARRITPHLAWNVGVDRGHHLDPFGMGARRHEFNDLLDERRQIDGKTAQFKVAGFDLGEIEQIIDERKQAFTRCLHRPGIGRLFRAQMCIDEQCRHAQNTVEGRAHLMAHGCQKSRF